MEKRKRSRCRECGRLVEQPAVGRPRSYCSVTCRRAAEYELRRVQSLLSRAQSREQDAALKVTLAEKWEAREAEAALAFWRGEVARLRAELRALLAGVGEGEGGASLSSVAPAGPGPA